MSTLVAVVSGFASGIFLRSVFVFGWPVILFIILLTVLFGAAAFVKPRLAYSLGAVFCLFVAFGMIRAFVADSPLPTSFASQLRHRVSYQGVVVSDPDVRDVNQRVEVRVSSGDESTIVLAVASRVPVVSVGEQVRVSGTLLVPEAFATDGGRIFRYDKYLQRDGVRFILDFGSISVLQKAPWYSIGAALASVKHLFLNGLQATLPEPYASLAGGVVIGGKTGLGTDLQNAFHPFRTGTNCRALRLQRDDCRGVGDGRDRINKIIKTMERLCRSSRDSYFRRHRGNISDRDARRAYGIHRALCQSNGTNIHRGSRTYFCCLSYASMESALSRF